MMAQYSGFVVGIFNGGILAARTTTRAYYKYASAAVAILAGNQQLEEIGAELQILLTAALQIL